MPKLYVLFVGLLGVVDEGSTGRVLLRKTSGVDRVGRRAHLVPRHLPRIVYGGQARPLPPGVRVRFELTTSDRFSIPQRQGFLQMNDILGERVSLSPRLQDFLAADVHGLLGTMTPMYTRVGQGNIYATTGPQVKVVKRFDPDLEEEEPFGVFEIANGMLLETNVANGVKVWLGPQEEILPEADTAQMADELQDVKIDPNETYYYVRVENLPEDNTPHHMDRDRLTDFHLYLLCDLVTARRRWVPVVEFPDQARFRPVAPGSQCITPILR